MTGAFAHVEEITLLSRAVLLNVFDEHNPERRAEAIQRIFAEDVRFVDHNGAHNGRAEISAAVERLHALLPGFRFTHASEPQVLEGAARLSWQFGPPSEPAKITGTDTILVRDGRISVLLVFLDHQPATSSS
jgi:SnoaL-like protein